MASREGLCPCLSQTNDSIVFCQLSDGHEGLHHWQDPVHPGHSKSWGGNVTEIQTDTRWRFESVAAMRKRLGLKTTEHGTVVYAPMTQDEAVEDAERTAVDLVSGEAP